MKEESKSKLSSFLADLREKARQALPAVKWPLAIFMTVYLVVIILWQVPQWQVPTSGITAKDRFQLETEARKTLATIVGGAFLLVGLYFAWRRIKATESQVRATEGQLRTMEANLEIAREGQITERFTRAIDQLGRDKPLEVRLGAIYALERIAKDSEKDHWPIMEVLTAYVREHAAWLLREENQPSQGLATPEPPVPPKPRVDVQAALTVIGRRRRDGQREEQPLDLRQTDLRGADIRRSHLEGAFLEEGHLEGAVLWEAHLEGAFLMEAHLERAHLWKAHLQWVTLHKAHLEGAFLMKAHLEGAEFGDAHLEGANLEEAHLEGANLFGAHLEGADFKEAFMKGARLEGVDLRGAKNLTREQIDSAIIDEETKLPDYLQNPEADQPDKK